MNRVGSVVLLSVVFGTVSALLAGCATDAVAVKPESEVVSSSAPSPTATPVVDLEAAREAQSWIDDAVLPAGAVRSDAAPSTSGGWGTERYTWWCSPTEVRTAYWTVPGATVVEAASWMSDHPTADLMVPIPFQVIAGTEPVTRATVLNYPTRESLEGIIYTISETPEGVAIRSIVGVIPATATCPTPEPGTQLGGPGMG